MAVRRSLGSHHKDCPVLVWALEQCLCAELYERDARREHEGSLAEAYRLFYDPDFSGGDEW